MAKADNESTDIVERNPESGRPAAIHAPQGGGFSGFMRQPGVKFVVIGILMLLLMVPALMVWTLVEERADRAQEVSARIAQGWGGEQVINGPYLAIPRSVPVSASGKPDAALPRLRHWILLMPENLKIDGVLTTETRRLSIYSLPVYNAKLKISGRFPPSLAADLADAEAGTLLDQAFLVMSISDIAGIRSDAAISIDGAGVRPVEPGLNGLSFSGAYSDMVYPDQSSDTGTGIYRPVDRATIERGFAFDLDLSLNGSGAFSVAPAGQTTELKLAADWLDPGFDGRFLPESKTYRDGGFEAHWTIPFLARGIDRVIHANDLPLSNSLLTVNFVESVKFYQLVSRTLKYAVAILSLVFLAVFIIELKGGRMVHWIQYVLTGLALVIFYILLLALAEHVGFAAAYAMAASLTTALIASYVGAVTKNRTSGLALSTTLAAGYTILYLILREDEYALLAGALVAFATIALTMFFTRDIDFSGDSKSPIA